MMSTLPTATPKPPGGSLPPSTEVPPVPDDDIIEANVAAHIFFQNMLPVSWVPGYLAARGFGTYGGRRTFSVLSLLYPGLDLSKEFHEDHIFPRSRFTAKRLAEAGIPPDQISEYLDAVDCLPNLQLLGGVPNTEKLAKLPADWLDGAFASKDQRDTYIRDNDLESLPLDLTRFLDFFSQRRERMRTRLVKLLGV